MEFTHREGSRARQSVTEDLRVLLALTPSFRLMIAHGYSDMITPYAVTRYELDHMPAAQTEERAQLRLQLLADRAVGLRVRAQRRDLLGAFIPLSLQGRHLPPKLFVLQFVLLGALPQGLARAIELEHPMSLGS